MFRQASYSGYIAFGKMSIYENFSQFFSIDSAEARTEGAQAKLLFPHRPKQGQFHSEFFFVYVPRYFVTRRCIFIWVFFFSFCAS